MDKMAVSTAEALLGRIQRATNEHDLDALVGCFNEAYVSQLPVHPARNFTGRDQVRKNWAQIFGGVPDLASRLVRSTSDGETVWAEWDWSGTRRDGAAHLMRGVTILGMEDGGAAWGRFYMEPVDEGGPGVDAAIAQAMGSAGIGR